MKNYLYILCAFLLAFAGCTKDADVEPIAPAPDGNTQVVLTGFSGRGTRTGFGGAEDGAVPFLWSAGDYIWASNTRSEAIAEGGSQATFIFESIGNSRYVRRILQPDRPGGRNSPDPGRADTAGSRRTEPGPKR